MGRLEARRVMGQKEGVMVCREKERGSNRERVIKMMVEGRKSVREIMREGGNRGNDFYVSPNCIYLIHIYGKTF